MEDTFAVPTTSTADAAEDGQFTLTPRKTGKLLIIGATRGTGRQVLDQALAAGYAVTALARDPNRLDRDHERLTVLRGDVLEPATLAPAVAGQDAVVSTLGVTSGRKPTTLYSEGMRNIIRAMRAAGVRRLMAISAGPLSIDEGDTLAYRRLFKPLLRAIFREPYADLARMEEEVRASGLLWTVVRPPYLNDTPLTGRYRMALNQSVRRGYAIGRADLAAALLALLDDPRSVGAAIGVAY